MAVSIPRNIRVRIDIHSDECGEVIRSGGQSLAQHVVTDVDRAKLRLRAFLWQG